MWKIVSIIKVNLNGSDLNSVISKDILSTFYVACARVLQSCSIPRYNLNRQCTDVTCDFNACCNLNGRNLKLRSARSTPNL